VNWTPHAPHRRSSRQSGVTIETIRYYERSGLLPPPSRAPSGRRLYDSDGINRLRFVRRCRALGFALADVGDMLGLIGGDVAECDAIHKIASANLFAVQSRINELTQMARTLTMMINDCDSGNDGCPMAKQLLGPE